MANETIVFSILRAGAAGVLTGDRIYPIIAPADAGRPYIVYTLIAGNPENHIDAPGGITHKVVQVDSYATTYAGARALADAALADLEALNYVSLGDNFVTQEPDTLLYRVSTDFSLWLHR